MRTTTLHLLSALVIATGCGGTVGIGGGGSGVGISGAINTARNPYEQSIEDWHENRIRRLQADDGWLSLVGLFPLDDGTYTLGSADDNSLLFPIGSPEHAGTLVVDDTLVTLKPSDGVRMTLDEKRIRHDIVLATDASPDGPSKVQMGPIQFYVIERPGTLYLRVKDANSPVRKEFTGIDRFPVDTRWRFDATLEPYDPPRLVKILNAAGYEETVPCPGALVFENDGQTHRLEPVSQEGDELFIVFGDASSGHDTYGGGRMLYVDMPGPDGKTVLDFNKAYNPPCVFTEFATCPLPTRENVLPFRIEAGEKAWGDAH